LRKSFRQALETSNAKEAGEMARAAIKAIDKAVQKKVLKRNTAARMKSRLMKKLNAMAKAVKK
jgi:small subunit ribosomal protein S20